MSATIAKPPPPMRINSNAMLIERQRSNRAISVSNMSRGYRAGRMPGIN